MTNPEPSAVGSAKALDNDKTIAYMAGFHAGKSAKAAVPAYCYIYEWDTPFGVHQSTSSNRYNGMPPTRSVPVYTHPAPESEAVDAARLREQQAIGAAIERACEQLPGGAELEIRLERGSGTVYYLNERNGAWYDIDGGDTFSSQISTAIERATMAAQKQEKP